MHCCVRLASAESPPHPFTTIQALQRMLKRLRSRTAVVSLLASWLAGCATLSGTTLQNTTQGQTELLLTRHTTPPAVVFENGLGGTLDWWVKVYPEIAKGSTALVYNRPGYGRSTATTAPRDGAQVVQELRQLLHQQGLNPPYVLVGHSLGGLYMQWFARRYPEEVQALVLVDSTHPQQMQGAGAPSQWPTWLKITFNVLSTDAARAEFLAIDATGQEVLAMPPLRDTPVWILSALKPMQDRSPLAEDANRKRADMVNLYPGARHIWVDSGHGIPLDAPQAVISAIHAALESPGKPGPPDKPAR